MRPMTAGSLFSGIGGMDIGLERAGFDVRWQIEIDEWCRAILAERWPSITRYSDVTTVDPLELEPVDLICGGFPCQPVSQAGKKRAQADERWLWPDFARIVRVLRPRFVLVENVTGLLAPVRVDHVDGRVLGWRASPIEEVVGDLAAEGYDAEWCCLRASDVGAPHERARVFIVAHTDRRSQGPRTVASSQREGGLSPAVDGRVADPDGAGRGERRGPVAVRPQHDPAERGGEAVAQPRGGRLESRGDVDAGRQRSRTERADERGDVADTEGDPERTGLCASDPRGQRRGRSGDGGGEEVAGSAVARLGRILDGLPDRLDPTQWPVPPGFEQWEWEAPRVAEGSR